MGCQPKYKSVYCLISFQCVIPYQITIVKRIYKFCITNYCEMALSGFCSMQALDKLLQHLKVSLIFCFLSHLYYNWHPLSSKDINKA